MYPIAEVTNLKRCAPRHVNVRDHRVVVYGQGESTGTATREMPQQAVSLRRTRHYAIDNSDKSRVIEHFEMHRSPGFLQCRQPLEVDRHVSGANARAPRRGDRTVVAGRRPDHGRGGVGQGRIPSRNSERPAYGDRQPDEQNGKYGPPVCGTVVLLASA